jgi:chaperonin GroEL
VLIDKKFGHPLVCNDGVTIARELELQEPVENLGMRVLREAAEKTGDSVGDGTTTSTLLAYSIFSEGIRNIAAGASAVDLKRGIERARDAAVRALRDRSRPVSGYQDRMQVATVSAHNDASIGKMVADALEKVGPDGVITVEEAKTTETVLDVVDGMQFDRGFISPYFVTDPEGMKAVLENCLILLYEKKITSMNDLLPLLEEWRPSLPCGQGSRLWRQAQGNDGGYRHSHRWAPDCRGIGRETREPSCGGPGPGEPCRLR